MPAPYVSPQDKTDRAFLRMLSTAIASNVMTGYKGQEAGQNTDGTENSRTLPCYVVETQDLQEYPKFTGNVRGNVHITVMTSADR